MNRVYAILVIIIVLLSGFFIYRKIVHKKSVFEEPLIPAPLYEK